MSSTKARLGILVGGGPAPGIDSAISACAIEAVNSGLDVIGIYDGFAHLIDGDTSYTTPLAISDVSRIHAQGGSILRTSRANPTRSAEDLEQCVRTLAELGVSYLVTIGGDDTALAASEVEKVARGAVRIVHIPKTIDNDLPLPGDMPTFGYETARHVGTQLVLNLMEDARTGNRWFIVSVMGRNAGHIALGIGKAAGATVTVIPEEFSGKRIKLDDVCILLEGAILKRRVMGREDGLAIVAEGIAEKLDPEELEALPGVELRRDPHGNLRLEEIPLATVLRRRVQERFAQRGDAISLVDVTLGYELRCAPPIPFDIDYTRTLGFGAVRFLLSESSNDRLGPGGLVCLENGHMRLMPFEELRDAATGGTRIRLVDMESQSYEVARRYMIRTESRDLLDPEMLAALASAAKITPDELRDMFAALA